MNTKPDATPMGAGRAAVETASQYPPRQENDAGYTNPQELPTSLPSFHECDLEHIHPPRGTRFAYYLHRVAAASGAVAHLKFTLFEPNLGLTLRPLLTERPRHCLGLLLCHTMIFVR